MTQRWNDLLFAHWPVPAVVHRAAAARGTAGGYVSGLGVAGRGAVLDGPDQVPRHASVPVARSFPELNLRTYVRDQQTGTPGVYFFSLDAGNLLAVAFARDLLQPAVLLGGDAFRAAIGARILVLQPAELAGKPVIFKARYRGLGPTRKLAESRSGSLEYFLTERYCLFTRNRAGQPMRANIHHVPWPLEEAEAEIEHNDLAAAHRASSCPTRSRCCTIRGGWRCTSGSWSGCSRARRADEFPRSRALRLEIQLRHRCR